MSYTVVQLLRRYSFDHGPMHFLQFSTEHDFGPGSEQFAWIVSDLKTVDRRRTPWLIAGFHRPFYTDSVYGNSDTGDVGFTTDIQNALERLFFQFQVLLTPLYNMLTTHTPGETGHIHKRDQHPLQQHVGHHWVWPCALALAEEPNNS